MGDPRSPQTQASPVTFKETNDHGTGTENQPLPPPDAQSRRIGPSPFDQLPGQSACPRQHPAAGRRHSHPGGDGGDAQGDLPAPQAVDQIHGDARPRLRARNSGAGPFPLQLLLQLPRHGVRPPSDSEQDPHDAGVETAGDAGRDLQLQIRPRAGDRPDRFGQIDDAGGDDRLHQRQPSQAHHHHRGPDRVRPPEQELHDRSPRGGNPQRIVPARPARSHALRPGHRADRRNARQRNHPPRPHLRRDGHAGLRHAAHQQRAEDGRPYHRRLPGG